MNPGRSEVRLYKGGDFRWQAFFGQGPTASTATVPTNFASYAATASFFVSGTQSHVSPSLSASGSINIYIAQAALDSLSADAAGKWTLKLRPPGGDSFVLISGAAPVVPEGDA